MYVWIWRHLPGPLVLRLLQAAVLLALAVTALFVLVFPRVEAALPYSDVTVPGPGSSTSPVPTGSPTPAPVGPSAPGSSAGVPPATLPAE